MRTTSATNRAPAPTCPESISRAGWSGFTMVEMLVVIAIIAFLAGLLMPALAGARKKATVAKAQVAISGLSTAFRAYYTEYGKWPAYTDASSGILYTTNGLVALLRGVDFKTTEGNMHYNGNPRGITFLEFQNQDLAIDSVNNRTNSVDPWKNQYECIFDPSYSNLSTNPFNNPVTFERAGFLVWSRGPDGKESSFANTATPIGDGVGVNKDNVKSW